MAKKARKPREMTVDEVREAFLRHVLGMTQYWAGPSLDGSKFDGKNWYSQAEVAAIVKKRLGGLAFSIMVALDGGSMGLPGFKVVPNPHEDDAEYCRKQGENWFPSEGDIAGYLHELLAKMDKP